MPDFLKRLLEKPRTLYVLSDADIDAMDTAQKRRITGDDHTKVVLYSDHIEKITVKNGLKVDGKFRRATGLVQMIRELPAKPDKVLIGEYLPNARQIADFIDKECPYLTHAPEILAARATQHAR